MNLYCSYSDYLKARFSEKVTRISINSGLGCPNRDGVLSFEGCVFCNEKGFSASALTKLNVEEQIKSAIEALSKSSKSRKFIAYFQNGTNTCVPADKLSKIISPIRQFPQIIGLSISTRPDYINDEILKVIGDFSKEYDVLIELGLASVHDRTLLALNRSHTYADFKKAVCKIAEYGIKSAAHIILGLDGESRQDMIETAGQLSRLPLWAVKMHVLHVLKDTKLEQLYDQKKITLLSCSEYVNLAADFLRYLRPDIIILRLVSDANTQELIAPLWINEKQKVIAEIKKELAAKQGFQGQLFNKEEKG